ncbi:TrfB-related DNA-binding protein [Nocardia sp. NPDC057455]|uniref:TrfB-related DNA-binding protein n=1 Tax=Nocardia sp. NPDC057455 TaxID=3346138 RepID=UPI00366E2F45
MARKNPHSPEKLAETQRNRNLALELRLAGKTQQQIAAETGWSKQRVSQYIKEAIAGITRENAEEYLSLELERLDAMWASIWQKIVSEPETSFDRKNQPWLIDRALAIMDQRARLTGTYKSAELRAIADAKGGISAGAASMLDRLFDAMELAVDAADAEDAESGE